MPEITVIHVALLAGALILGLAIGWIFRGKRGEVEKLAISVGWQEQFEAQRSEHGRLLEQNKSLMEQNSQYQASNKDSKLRATELSSALKEAIERRDELQRQLKDIRGNLEAAVQERNQLQSDIANRNAEVDVTATALKQRDDRITQLSKELAGWQERVPPLIERFRTRNEDAIRLEGELAEAQGRIGALEAMLGSDDTRVEPVDREALDELYASNEPLSADEESNDTDDDAGASDIDEPEEDEAVQDPAQELPVADAVPAANGHERDDLKLIKGVGPAIEKTLNEMGIWRFHQIAEMSEYEIDRVARRLKGFRSRIYREDWMGQARDLDERKATSAY